ncbi:MAG: flagellar hook-basal body complex protein [Nitrospina sp.]|nr:MAG: flagellar hook-basal body complex protein [Nitrospina sp.]
MSLIGTLATGVSGLLTNSRALNIIGDNISNVNTTGFKSSKAVFGDLFSTSLGGGTLTSQVGRGAQLIGSLQSFAQGSFELSTNALDLAIDGNGFFIVNDGTGNFYTRAGQFRVNENGLVEVLTGEILQGFEILANNVVGNTLTDVSLTGVQSQPQPTTTFTLGAQLDGSEVNPFTFNSPIQVFNSVGTQDILNIQFTREPATVPTTNLWSVLITSQEGTVTTGAAGFLEFGPTGQLIDVDIGAAVLGNTVTDWAIIIDYSTGVPPAALLPINWDLADTILLNPGVTNGDMTAFAAPSANNSVIQDGFGSGVLVGVGVDFDGTVFGSFDNGQSQNLFQLGLANFLSPTGLTRLGQNLFGESRLSGQPIISLPETGSFGSVLGSTLELSNVDLAEEFVNLIKTQQAFVASARIISTTDELLTETVNLTR